MGCRCRSVRPAASTHMAAGGTALCRRGISGFPEGGTLSPGKFSLIPRGCGPEFLARWANRSGYWRLAVYDRTWNVADSVYTNEVVSGPRPGDQWLKRIGFVPAGDGEWVEVDGGWELPVARAGGMPPG